MALAQTPDAFLSRTTTTAWNVYFSWCGWRRIDVDRGEFTILTYLGDAAIGGGFQFTVDPDRQLIVYNCNDFSDLLAGAGPTVPVGEWWFFGITTIAASEADGIEIYYAAEGDASLTQVTATYLGPYDYTRHGVGWRPGNDGDDGAFRLHGSWAYEKTWTDTTLTPTEMLAEFQSTVPATTSGLWSFWAGDTFGLDLTGNARPLTATAGTGTFADTDPPAIDGPPVPSLLAASATTTDASSYSTASIAPHDGSFVVMDVLGRDSVTVGAPAIGGSGITGTALDVALANSWTGVQLFRFARYTAEGTGVADTIDFDWTGVGGAPLTGAGWVVASFPAGTEIRQTTTAEGSGTALTAGTLSAFGTDGAGFVGWATGLNSAATPEAGWVELFDAGYNSPTTRLIANWRGSQDTTPTGTTGSTAGWAGIASELGPASGDGTAMPAAIAVGVTIPQAAASAGAGPSAIAATGTLPAPSVTGAGLASPAAIPVPVTVPAVSPSAGSTIAPPPLVALVTIPAPGVEAGASPPPIAAVSTLPAPTATGGGTATPAPLEAQVSLPAVTATGAASATPTAIAAPVTLPAPAGSAAAGPSPIEAPATLPPVTATGGGSATATPVVISVAVTILAVAASAGAGPSAILVDTSIPPATTTGGSGATASPAAIAVAASVPAAVISAGATVSPAAVLLAVLLPQVTATGGAAPSEASTVGTYREPGVGDYQEPRRQTYRRAVAAAWREP